jgi:hypothetical protein
MAAREKTFTVTMEVRAKTTQGKLADRRPWERALNSPVLTVQQVMVMESGNVKRKLRRTRG